MDTPPGRRSRAGCRTSGQALEECARRGIPVDALVVLTRRTAPRLNGILRLAHRLGAERVGILRLYPLGRAKRIDLPVVAFPMSNEAPMQMIE